MYVVITTPTTELVDDAHLLSKWSGCDATNSNGVHVFSYNQRLALQWRLRGGGGTQMALYTVFSPSNLSLGRHPERRRLGRGERRLCERERHPQRDAESHEQRGGPLDAGRFDLILGAGDVDAGTARVPDTTNGAPKTTLIHEVRFYRGRHDTARRTATEAELRTKWAV